MSGTISINYPSLIEAIAALRKLNEDDSLSVALSGVTNSLPESSTGMSAELARSYEAELAQMKSTLDLLYTRTIELLENTAEHFKTVDIEVAWTYDEIGSQRVGGV